MPRCPILWGTSSKALPSLRRASLVRLVGVLDKAAGDVIF